jgi:hypothetical protein
MTIVGCAEFESALADLLADPEGAAADRRELLRLHATSCVRCGGALGLVDLAATPSESRDPIPDPGPVYWRGFEEKLAARIAEATRRSSRRRRIFWGAGAIAIAASSTLVLLAPRRPPSGTETAAARPPQVAAPAPAAPSDAATAAPARESRARASVRSATPPPPSADAEAVGEDDLSDAFDLGARPDPFADADEAALFPSVDELSDDERERFADWLAREEERVRRGAV